MKSLDKFNEDKSYKYFPGVAIIHFIRDEGTRNFLKKVVKEMKQSNLFDKYVFLPKSSYHSTISDLLTYNDLKLNPIFNNFPLNEESKESVIDNFVSKSLKNSSFNLNVKMNVTKITARKVHLEPATEVDRGVLNDFRMKIANILNIPFDENYKFHISLSYKLEHLSGKEQMEIDNFLIKLNELDLDKFNVIYVDVCELVTFNNMSEFININEGRVLK